MLDDVRAFSKQWGSGEEDSSGRPMACYVWSGGLSFHPHLSPPVLPSSPLSLSVSLYLSLSLSLSHSPSLSPSLSLSVSLSLSHSPSLSLSLSLYLSIPTSPCFL